MYKELFMQIKSAFNSSLWSRARLNEIGILTSGISVQDINEHLDSDLISSFIPESFQKMSLDVLTKIVQSKQIYQSLDRQQLSQMQENKYFSYLDNSIKDKILNEFDGGYSKVLANMQTNVIISNLEVTDQSKISGSSRLKSTHFDFLMLFLTILIFLVVFF